MYQGKTYRIATTIVLLGVMLIVTHVVVPTVDADTRPFNKGRSQPDLVSHMYKHIHKTAHPVGKKYTRTELKHHGQHNEHGGHDDPSCPSQSHEFVCQSRGENTVNSLVHLTVESFSYGHFVNHIHTLEVFHLADLPPPRLPHQEKIRLLI